MPVFDFDFAKSCTNLDMSAARSGIFTPNLTSLELHDHELHRFNDLARRLAPGQPPFTRCAACAARCRQGPGFHIYQSAHASCG